MMPDSTTTDHIAPPVLSRRTARAEILVNHGVKRRGNNYGSRRDNHEVMMATLPGFHQNRMLPVEGGVTKHIPSGEILPIWDAAERYMQEGTPLIILAGKEYGSGSSRDWAAKGPQLQGVRAVIAESFERIHRSNLVGMGVLPLEFLPARRRRPG